jgi:hypothetical protein
MCKFQLSGEFEYLVLFFMHLSSLDKIWTGKPKLKS